MFEQSAYGHWKILVTCAMRKSLHFRNISLILIKYPEFPYLKEFFSSRPLVGKKGGQLKIVEDNVRMAHIGAW